MRTKPVLILFFAAVALLGAASLYFSTTIERADRQMTALVSPDGRFKAVRLTFSGGGDQPFCVDGISVLLAAYPDHFADKNRAYEVYSAPCDAHANRAASPKVEWTAARELRIMHPVAPVGPDAKKVVMKERDVTRSVKVTFVTVPY